MENRGLIGAVLALIAVLPYAAQAQVPALPNAPPTTPIINLEARQTSGQLVVPVDKSQLLHVDQQFGEISVGNKDIADVVPLSRNLIYVLGKKRGATNLTISDQNGNIVSVVDVTVTFDTDALRRSLADVLPEEKVSIRTAGDALILSGVVSSSDRLRQIVQVAERYAPNAVTNLLSVGSSQQVLLEVRFAEVARNALTNLGANFLLNYNNGNGTYGIASGTQASGPLVGGVITPPAFGVPPTSFGGLAGQLTDNLSYNLQASVDALEQKGLLRTLAQPNLVALSGDTASFLAGGQIPIPVAQTSTGGGGTGSIPVITVEFKDFGVSLAFTPTVVSKEQINLELASEVSAIDPTLSVRTGDVVVPGLKVRRARTTIELKDGQSFSIAGLLQDNFQDGVNQLPILGSIPILGTLFRSTNYQHAQTELVVLITTHLVDPSIVRNLATPTDAVVLPSPTALFGNGKVEGGNAANAGAARGTSANGYVLP